MGERYSREHLAAWRRDGAVVIPSFFEADEVRAIEADFAGVFGRTEGAEAPLVKRGPDEIGRFNPAQFASIEAIPFDCSPALNLAGLHPALIALAAEALGTHDLRLYQCQAWAKFTGDADYDQPFHCDFANHTLTAPSEDTRANSITFICFFSEVSEAHGPTHYLTRPDSERIAGPEASLSRDPDVQARLQRELPRYARSNASPAGSVFAYGIDVYHRGTNMTAPGGHRYALTSCFKRAGDDAIGFHAWQFHHMKPWARVFDHATPEQLACFGVQPPGHPFWTEETLRRAQARYPGWDMTHYREAIGSGARAKLEVSS
jgi:hypothetical protein